MPWRRKVPLNRRTRRRRQAGPQSKPRLRSRYVWTSDKRSSFFRSLMQARLILAVSRSRRTQDSCTANGYTEATDACVPAFRRDGGRVFLRSRSTRLLAASQPRRALRLVQLRLPVSCRGGRRSLEHRRPTSVTWSCHAASILSYSSFG